MSIPNGDFFSSLLKGSPINHTNTAVTSTETPQDFSILEVDPAMDEGRWREVMRLNIERPSLQPPTSQAIMAAGYGQLQDPFQDKYGFMPCDDFTCVPPFHRSIATLDGASASNGLWSYTGNEHLVHSDSGSPLFYLRDDGSREGMSLALLKS